MKAIALYDCMGAEDVELTFLEGDVINTGAII
jgi:hypothetical protein